MFWNQSLLKHGAVQVICSKHEMLSYIMDQIWACQSEESIWIKFKILQEKTGSLLLRDTWSGNGIQNQNSISALRG